MLALISASVTLANLLLSLVIGIRLFRLARHGSGFGPEFWLASFFFFAAFLGAGLNISVYAGLADPALALQPPAWRARARGIDLHLLRGNHRAS